MKLRVIGEDGKYKGGLLEVAHPIILEEHCWEGSRVPGYSEFLLLKLGRWWLVQLSHNPDWSGSELTDDLFDSHSEARALTPQHAMKWCANQPFDPPQLLLDDLARRGVIPDVAVALTSCSSADLLPPALQEAWHLLEHSAMTAKQMGQVVAGGPIGEDAIRKRIAELNRRGFRVINVRGQGYIRPDAPPITHQPEHASSE